MKFSNLLLNLLFYFITFCRRPKFNRFKLGILLTGMTPKESKKVIPELIKKLLVLQSKLSEKPKNVIFSQNVQHKILEDVEIIEHIDQDFETDS